MVEGYRTFEGEVLNFSSIGFIVLVSICLLFSLYFIVTSIYPFAFNEFISFDTCLLDILSNSLIVPISTKAIIIFFT